MNQLLIQLSMLLAALSSIIAGGHHAAYRHNLGVAVVSISTPVTIQRVVYSPTDYLALKTNLSSLVDNMKNAPITFAQANQWNESINHEIMACGGSITLRNVNGDLITQLNNVLKNGCP